ncbi:MAG: glycosyltransferase family 87 protein [Verrucomicrobiota bacterium]
MLKENPENGYQLIYRDYIYMDWLIRLFHYDMYEAKNYQRDHNYRYGPIVAKISEWALILPYKYWPALWFGLSILLAGVSYFFLDKSLDLRINPISGLLVVLGYPSSVYLISLYQNSFVSLAIVCSAGYLVCKKKSFLAGLLFGVIFYKPQILVYVTAFVLFTGNIRFVLGAGLSSTLFMLISLAVCGLDAHLYWFQSLSEVMRGIQGDEMQTNIPWKGFVLTVFPEAWHQAGLIGGQVIMFAVFIWSQWMIWHQRKEGAWKEWYSLYWGVAFWALFSPHVKVYELSLALPCWFLMLSLQSSFYKKDEALKVDTLHGLFWTSGFLALFCRFIGASIVAPLLTLWYILCLLLMSKKVSVPSKSLKTG